MLASRQALLLALVLLFTLLASLTTLASSFNIDDEAVAAASRDDNTGGDTIDLFDWARQNGAEVSDSIEIRDTVYGGRGLFANKRIPANTEIIRIPYHLQLGVRQLAEGTDEEMQQMARSLPWDLIRQNELFFVPLSVALIAEARKTSSIFGPFLHSLPRYCANAVGAVTDWADEDLEDLLHWAPTVASKVKRRRAGIKSLHDAIAPPSVSIDDLQWAATNVCSRSLVRKRIKELTSDQVRRVGEFAASDHSRMLPVIDLVNHGSLEKANVWVGHLPRGNEGGAEGDEDTNDFSTSLKTTREIEAGEELLFDYGGGGGEKISNDRLLLDYGFVLPGHTDRVSIGLEELRSTISTLRKGEGMKDLPQKDADELNQLTTFLIQHASKLQSGAPILFTSGEPTTQTLALAITMTCRDRDDVSRVLQPLHRILAEKYDSSLLPGQIVESCTELQKEYAGYTLKSAAAVALDHRPRITNDNKREGECDANGKGAGSFADVSREYSVMCRQKLKEVAE